VLQNLLYVYVHLSEHNRRHTAAIGFVGKERHTVLKAERLEDRL
jgi:hypothetical protein